ncbi:MAG: WXG100 family type VII secretion target [Eubacterium sp.]|nr:WXG100 family type VII secretion target [Eubacterium sp.]MDD7208469.1 WXG100 family type VII secretion target [Lachnospiraceae bacterium]MDY5497592.1 WXG100 family type VII secretion target [Anaerobutyricum sp.]
MGNIINVTPEKLQGAAGSFQSAGAGLKKTAMEMIQLITGISSSIWSGEACSSYLNKFKGLETDINRMYKMVEEESAHLMMIAREYQSAERQNKAASASLKNNVII